jgi:hypothetical protein
VRTQKRKATIAASVLKQAELKVEEADDAKMSMTELKQQKTRAEGRSAEWDNACVDSFSTANLSTAMLSEKTGINDCMKHWCNGSPAKVAQIVMSLIKKHGLEEQVAADLGRERCETNDYIVNRARSALQALKKCRVEEERQQYRLVLTALAPVDNTGMGRRTAEALGINRNGKPFTDAIQKRAVIDAAILKKAMPLAVGDDVVCRHGVGQLIKFTGPDQPCAVTIGVGEFKHTSEFSTAGRGPSGRRLRRTPISFAHDRRSRRSDVLDAALVEKVPCATVLVYGAGTVFLIFSLSHRGAFMLRLLLMTCCLYYCCVSHH